MASSDKKDEAKKYKDWTRLQLEDECNKRGLKFDKNNTDDDLIYMLVKDDNTPDWAEIITTLISHTSLKTDDIANSTIPAIQAVLARLNKHVSIKIGIPGIFGGALDTTSSPSTHPDKPPKLSEFMAFASAFDGIK